MAEGNETVRGIIAEVGVTGQERIAYQMRLASSPEYARQVLDVVVAGEAAYIVVRTSTVQNTRRPRAFEPVAAILPYEEYRRLCEGAGEDRG